ncbi:uncharacterized protein LOC143179540 [Calliopsis andreniformis]|uniref:uncharacterized protein LOC143179540 n=1 Tax=Calliopsis andreniformis TaxID=337506 RepID=UPI003FCD845F
MEERYMTMERELIRTKMLSPMITRNVIPVHQKSQTDVNWGECCLAKKYGNSCEISSRSEYRNVKECKIRNQERILPRKKHHTSKKSRNSIDKTLNDIDWTKYRNSFQNLQDDMYPSRISVNHTCRPNALNNNSTAICSTHNVAVILPEVPTQSTDISKCDRNNSKANNNRKVTEKYNTVKIFGGPKKCLTPFKVEKILPSNNKVRVREYCVSIKNEICLIFKLFTIIAIITHKKMLMEACQRFDKKHEPETSCRIDFDVKHEDHMQTSSTVNTPTFRPIMGAEFESTSKIEQRELNGNEKEKCPFTKTKFFENTDIRHKENSQESQMFEGNRNHWNNHFKKLPSERTHLGNESSRNFARLIQKNVRGQKRTPTPRSNVHTAYTPMEQTSASNPMLDPNSLTIQLLRLAVLLYAPALMPALNSLIARRNYQTSIPIPCFEGSNDLLAQVFRILSNQQCVPNLPYAPHFRVNENLLSQVEPNPPDPPLNREPHSEGISRRFLNSSSRGFTNRQEKNSIAVNTSLDGSSLFEEIKKHE